MLGERSRERSIRGDTGQEISEAERPQNDEQRPLAQLDLASGNAVMSDR